MNTNTRLTRSRTDRMIAGVAAGVAQYLQTDPLIVRLVFILLAFSGPGFLLYPLLWVVMPEAAAPKPSSPLPHGHVFVATGETQRLHVNAMSGAPDEFEQEVPINNAGHESAAPGTTHKGSQLLGYVLLGLGAFIALQMIWPGFVAFLFPAALIGAGVWLLQRQR